ncbi:MAG: hypothetical protein ACOC4Y_01245 [bacterium]
MEYLKLYCPGRAHKHVPTKDGEKEIKKILCALSKDRKAILVQCNDKSCKKDAQGANWWRITLGDVPVIERIAKKHLNLSEEIHLYCGEADNV